MAQNQEMNLALFLDFDNIALGLRDAHQRFDIHLLLQRLLEKGKIVVKRAYADWQHHREYMDPLHEAGIELIEIPARRMTGKNNADIRLVVDAMDLCYSKDHIDSFVIVSGDSDFSPLVSKLRENAKQVIGVGVKNSTSKLLVGNCDEFIFYDDLISSHVTRLHSKIGDVPADKRKLFDFLVLTSQRLLQESKGVLYGSLIKDTMKRKRPDFNEGKHGYSTFGDLLEDAKAHGLLDVTRDDRAGGTWVVRALGKGMPAPAEPASEENGRKRRRRPRRRGERDGEIREPEGREPAEEAEASEARGAPGGQAEREIERRNAERREAERREEDRRRGLWPMAGAEGGAEAAEPGAGATGAAEPGEPAAAGAAAGEARREGERRDSRRRRGRRSRGSSRREREPAAGGAEAPAAGGEVPGAAEAAATRSEGPERQAPEGATGRAGPAPVESAAGPAAEKPARQPRKAPRKAPAGEGGRGARAAKTTKKATPEGPKKTTRRPARKTARKAPARGEGSGGGSGGGGEGGGEV